MADEPDQSNESLSQADGQPNPAPEAAAASAEKAERPGWLPESFWNAEAAAPDLDKFGQHYTEIATRIAEDDIRRQGVPTDPKGYKLDFAKAEGSAFEIAADDPFLPKLQELAHKHGLPQEAFAGLLGLRAELYDAEAAQLSELHNAEKAKLGANGPARVDALTKAIAAATGKKEPALMKGLFTAEQVEELESVLRARGSFTQRGREPEVVALTPEQRMYPTMQKRA